LKLGSILLSLVNIKGALEDLKTPCWCGSYQIWPFSYRPHPDIVSTLEDIYLSIFFLNLAIRKSLTSTMRGDICLAFFLLYPTDFIRYLRLLAMFLTLPMDKKFKVKSVFFWQK